MNRVTILIPQLAMNANGKNCREFATSPSFRDVQGGRRQGSRGTPGAFTILTMGQCLGHLLMPSWAPCGLRVVDGFVYRVPCGELFLF